MRRALIPIVSLLLAATGTAARATPAEPSGPHPRMLLDRELREAWRADARRSDGPVARAIRVCRKADETSEGSLYHGAGWAKVLQACLVAWGATDRPVHARTAIRYFTALLDDLDKVGDRKGGEESARRDHGYAIRNLGPYTALAYDWLHDQPGMTPELLARARQRWVAWLDWYRENGYRARNPGTNYHAGYLAAATLIAIAQGGEAGPTGARLWQLVADELWGKDMAAALSKGGILDGGDWPEGWQYGPLSVAHYAVAAHVARKAGIEIAGLDVWLGSVLRRHVYGLTPGDRLHVGQDTGVELPTVEANALTLDAVVLGDATPDDKRWAKSELLRLRLVEDEYLLYDALALPGDRPAAVPRETWPTWYAAPATGTVFARTRWDDRAVWLAAECAPALDVDHRQPKAGNFVLSRGADDVIVDPSPYGALSSLTSNAPTVKSAHLPQGYAPSQGPWSVRTSWDWQTQRSSGVIALRCDYSDQYRYQHRASDVPDAIRDLVFVPSANGTDATLIVVDRASTGGGDRPLYLRFRVPGKLALEGDVATASVGRRTKLVIAGLSRSAGKPELGTPPAKDCFKEGTTRGGCIAARFPVTDYRVEVAGPEPRAVHAISATGGAAPSTALIGGESWSGVRLGGVRDAVVVWPKKPHDALEYRAPRGRLIHVLLDAPETDDGKATIAARADGADCVVKVTAGGEVFARPAVVQLDEACAVTVDPEVERALPSGTRPGPRPQPTSPTSKRGCCGAQTSPEAPLATAVLVGVLLLRRRRRPTRGGRRRG
ncbi:MAG TPA: hypothetical protein VNO30_38780 [Kofleriaceae bacterium]|nr:hypothetical protein [Kofleriaceae bacterium]